MASRNGWRPTKRGWPDFLCFDERSGEIIAVEVKPRGLSGRLKILKRDQASCMDFLTAHGIRCFVSDGLSLEPFSRELHASESRRRLSYVARIARATAPLQEHVHPA